VAASAAAFTSRVISMSSRNALGIAIHYHPVIGRKGHARGPALLL
jgi:hypothetical protein